MKISDTLLEVCYMKKIKLLGIVLMLGIIIPSKALAYIDPGTGSIVIQSIIATIAGVGFACKVYWSNIKNYFSRKKND